MCLSCFAGLAREVPSLVSARRKGGDAKMKAVSSPARAAVVPPLPIKAAVLEPALARWVQDEEFRRQSAEAEAAALQRQLESGQELEEKLLEAAEAKNDAPSDAQSLCVLRSRLSELQAQLDDERSKSRFLKAQLLGGTPHPTPRGDLSERISREREICNLQEHLAQEISKRMELQAQLESFRRQTLSEHTPRRSSCDLASPRCRAMATTLRLQAPTRTQSPAPSSTCVETPSEAASSSPNTPTPGFGGPASYQAGVSIRSGVAPPLAASAGAKSEPGYSGTRRGWPEEVSGNKMSARTLVPAGTSSCFTPRSALHPGQLVVAGGEAPSGVSSCSAPYPVTGGKVPLAWPAQRRGPLPAGTSSYNALYPVTGGEMPLAWLAQRRSSA